MASATGKTVETTFNATLLESAVPVVIAYAVRCMRIIRLIKIDSKTEMPMRLIEHGDEEPTLHRNTAKRILLG